MFKIIKLACFFHQQNSGDFLLATKICQGRFLHRFHFAIDKIPILTGYLQTSSHVDIVFYPFFTLTTRIKLKYFNIDYNWDDFTLLRFCLTANLYQPCLIIVIACLKAHPTSPFAISNIILKNIRFTCTFGT